MKIHSPGCTCCGCKFNPMFSDDFSTEKEGYLSTSDRVFNVIGGKLVASGTGSYWRNIETTATKNLYLSVSCQVFNNDAGDGDHYGIYVGGICSIYHQHIGGGNYKCHVGQGVDGFGENPTSVFDLGFVGPNINLNITIQNDWTDTGHVFIKFTGGAFGSYAVEMDVEFGSKLDIGMFGDGKWDNFSIIRNHNANVCSGCIACTDPKKLPKTLLLSVPPMSDRNCNCEQLSGDFVLKYKTYLNFRCLLAVDCGYVCDEVGLCGGVGTDPCGIGNLWWLRHFAGAATLQATNAVDILQYNCLSFNCDEGAANTFNYSCSVCENSCEGIPTSLITVNGSY